MHALQEQKEKFIWEPVKVEVKHEDYDNASASKMIMEKQRVI